MNRKDFRQKFDKFIRTLNKSSKGERVFYAFAFVLAMIACAIVLYTAVTSFADTAEQVKEDVSSNEQIETVRDAIRSVQRAFGGKWGNDTANAFEAAENGAYLLLEDNHVCVWIAE